MVFDKNCFVFVVGSLNALPVFSNAAEEFSIIVKRTRFCHKKLYFDVDCYPTIMQPTRFVFEKDISPVYYSSQVPSTYVFSPRARKISSTLSEMRELEYIMKCFLEELKCKNGVCSDTVLHQIANQVEFKYFHNEDDKHQVIHSSKQLMESDPRFANLSEKLTEHDHYEFSSDAKFLRGCVRINSLKNTF